MTNDQRKQLLTLIQDHGSIRSIPRAEFVHISWRNWSIKIDYCLKHGTGSGRIVGLVSFGNTEFPESIGDIDDVLLSILVSYETEMVDAINEIDKLVKEIVNNRQKGEKTDD